MRLFWWIVIIIALLVAGVVAYEILAPPVYIKKPAIYLYPETEMPVSVRLTIDGTLTHTIPSYGHGWNVLARPDGLIDNTYDYLFYEAKLGSVNLPSEGWIVPREKLSTWFDTQLPLLGLNIKEINQFKEYWLSKLPIASYYDIRKIDDSFLQKHLALFVHPQPQTIIRVELAFKPLKKPYTLPTPKLIRSARQGFTVVE